MSSAVISVAKPGQKPVGGVEDRVSYCLFGAIAAIFALTVDQIQFQSYKTLSAKKFEKFPRNSIRRSEGCKYNSGTDVIGSTNLGILPRRVTVLVHNYGFDKRS